jgi:hypothetical protein
MSQASDVAVPHRLFAAGLWWFPSSHQGEEDGIGERRTGQITVAVPPPSSSARSRLVWVVLTTVSSLAGA